MSDALSRVTSVCTVYPAPGVIVIPAGSQHRGRIFLPFLDEDLKTTEILSKVILFAEDRRLKDPTIPEQIVR